MSEDKKKSLFDDSDDLFATTTPKTENKNENGLADKAFSVFGADSFFAATRAPRQVNAEGDVSESSTKSTLEEAMKLFSSVSVDTKTEKEKAKEIERHQEFLRRRIQRKKDDLAKDIQGVMLNEYGCIAKDIIPTLSCDMVVRKKLVEFLSKYMAQIAQTNSEAYFAFDNDEEIEKVIKRLKSSCVEIESVINSEYEKHFNSLYEDQDGELVLEAKRIEDATKAERDLLILQYKTLFLEYVVLLEKHCEIVRNRPKF